MMCFWISNNNDLIHEIEVQHSQNTRPENNISKYYMVLFVIITS